MIVKPSRVTDSISHNVDRTGIRGGDSKRSAYSKKRTVRPKAPHRKKGTKLHGP